MTLRRSGPLSLLVALPVAALVGCSVSNGGATTGSTAGAGSEATLASTENVPGSAPAPGDLTPSPAEPVPESEPVPEPEPEPRIRAGLVAGTDSSTPPAGGHTDRRNDHSIEGHLVDFGITYLGFDYRAEPGERLAALQPLVAGELYAELARPLPAALREQVESERLVVRAQFVEGWAVEAGVYQLTFTIETSAGGDERSELRTLTVAVDDDRLVTDVR